MASKKPKKGAKGGSGEAGDSEAAPAGGNKKLIIGIAAGVVVLVLAVGGGLFFMLNQPKADAAETKPEYVPGEVLPLDPISINLNDGHYLRLGLSLQLTTEAAGHKPDGSKALDLAIETFSGQPIEEVNEAQGRAHLKEELTEKVAEAYHHKVMAIYFTQFVTQ